MLVVLIGGAGFFLYSDNKKIGNEEDSYKGVPVYYNGIVYTKSYGKHYSTDGYYYGQKWQCVEFVKRFFYEAKKHKMPDVMGHARDFFDPNVPQGEINERRGLIQFRNGGNVKPAIDDLVVFTDTKYGHVAIITRVESTSIEVIQQNIFGKPRQIFQLTKKEGNYFVGNDRQPAGWLRK